VCLQEAEYGIFRQALLREIFDYVPGTVVMYIFKDRVIKPFLYTDDVPAFSGLTEQEYLDRYGEDAETAIMSEGL